MTKHIRVHELAKELGVASRELIEILRHEGVDANSHLSAIEVDIAEIIKEQIKTEDSHHELNDIDLKPEKDTDAKADQSNDSKEQDAASIKKSRDSVQKNQNASETLEDKVVQEDTSKQIHVKPPIIVKDLAIALGMKPNEVIHNLLKMNVFASINQTLDLSIAEKVCTKLGFELVADKRAKQTTTADAKDEEITPEDIVYADEEVVQRPPVVAFLGHVDHGKTSLLDRVRNTNVTAKEAGGITQHIGATTVKWKDNGLTFIDTPGHEAFTSMRARGANTTDIAVLVVASDDGVMPQTLEAINHAKAAKVPIVVALNKIDLPSADPLKVMTQLQQNGLALEEWGGEVGVVEVSATTGQGIDDLIERLLLESEILELKANPKLPVKAIVLESQLEQGLGTTVNILIKNGTIHIGDVILCGQYYGRVKTLINNKDERIKSAGPSYAAKVVGLSGLPEGGTILVGCDDERQAKKLTENREYNARTKQLQPQRHTNLNDLFKKIKDEARKELKVIVKTDTQGTGEAVVDLIRKLETKKIKVEVIHVGVGAITDNDILLASASDAIVVGFHVRVNQGVNSLATKEGVEIRLYSVIYELAEQLKESMSGMLDPELREEQLGKSEILQIFTPSKGGKICGCSVTKGLVRQGAKARVYRGNELIYNGIIQSLRRFNEDVKVVKQGYECGIRLDHFNDFEVGDKIDIYDFIEVAATLD